MHPHSSILQGLWRSRRLPSRRPLLRDRQPNPLHIQCNLGTRLYGSLYAPRKFKFYINFHVSERSHGIWPSLNILPTPSSRQSPKCALFRACRCCIEHGQTKCSPVATSFYALNSRLRGLFVEIMYDCGAVRLVGPTKGSAYADLLGWKHVKNSMS